MVAFSYAPDLTTHPMEEVSAHSRTQPGLAHELGEIATGWRGRRILKAGAARWLEMCPNGVGGYLGSRNPLLRM
jgi:hypothetical protein